jgi:NADH:ubiquinone reductase (non-electrogenic)
MRKRILSSSLESLSLARRACARHLFVGASNQSAEKPSGGDGPKKAAMGGRGGKQKLVVLGTGWGAARLVHDLDTKKYKVTVVSPRNHMVFTPLLPQTTVGTLDFRSVAVSMRNIQPALYEAPNYFYNAKAISVDRENQTVLCDSEGSQFKVDYDQLVVATGAAGSTFGIPGVTEHAHFLRDVSDADAVRQKLMFNICHSNIPGLPESEKRRLLNFVIVGGGPTGVEFAGELSNLVKEDLTRIMPDVSSVVRITLIEAKSVLSSFNPDLQYYASRVLSKSGVEIVRGSVKIVGPKSIVLSCGSEIDYGMLVWSTGVGPTEFIQSLPFLKTALGRLCIDSYLRVKDEEGKVSENVMSLGDCACNPSNPLPTTAQVAEQHGKWLAKHLNNLKAKEEPFQFRYLGQMSALSTGSAVTDLGEVTSITGWASWLGWRAVYFTKLGSLSNKLYVILNWSTTMLLGRDLTRW